MAILEFWPESVLRGSVICCHGFRGTKENGGNICQFAAELNNLGLGVIAFDFAGSGESPGNFAEVTLSGQKADLNEVIAYVAGKTRLPLFLLGRSFGGSTVIAAASDPQVLAVILWSAPVLLFSTFTHMLGEDQLNAWQKAESVVIEDEDGSYELGYQLLKDFARHNMEDYLTVYAASQRPLLIVQGMDDDVVLPDNAYKIKELVPHAQLNIVGGADHRFTGMTELRQEMTLAWIKDILDIN